MQHLPARLRADQGLRQGLAPSASSDACKSYRPVVVVRGTLHRARARYGGHATMSFCRPLRRRIGGHLLSGGQRARQRPITWLRQRATSRLQQRANGLLSQVWRQCCDCSTRRASCSQGASGFATATTQQAAPMHATDALLCAPVGVYEPGW